MFVGRRCWCRAIQFLNHSATFADTLAFILPVSFRKWSVQSRVNTSLSLLSNTLLPNYSFILDGLPYDVRCCFQIWSRTGDNNMRLTASPAISHPDFTMWQYNNTTSALNVFNNAFDFAVPRQGYVDYTRRETSQGKREHSTQWMLFKANSSEALERLLNLDFQELAMKNTSTPGFGKADVVAAYRRGTESSGA